MSQEDNKNPYFIRSVNRALSVFNSFNSKHLEWGITDLAEQLDLHKSTMHRLMSLLESEGFLEKNQVSQKYRLSLKFLELGRLVQESFDVRKIALPYLQQLSDRVNKTVHLVVRDGNEAIYIEKIDRPDAVVQYSRVGKRLQLHCSAVGKIFLADLSEEEVENLLGRNNFEAYTKNTITTLPELLVQVREVREKGFAFDREELEYGLVCVGAPIKNEAGRVLAGISISGPPHGFTGVIDRLITELLRTAGDISARLGLKKYNAVEAD